MQFLSYWRKTSYFEVSATVDEDGIERSTFTGEPSDCGLKACERSPFSWN